MPKQDIISISDFSKDELEAILEASFKMEEEVNAKGSLDLLRGKILASLFFEPSTRTRFSFEAAMFKLGGQVVSATGVNFSSMAKGETLEDTIKTIERYADVIVIRHPELGSAKIAAGAAKIPVVNAGDGPGDHPTQAFLDFYTIKKEKKTIEGLKIAMVGDLKYGRTMHSTIQLLSLYNDVKFYLVSPEELKTPSKYLENVADYEETEDLKSVLPEVDVLYMTRIQKERFAEEADYLRLKDSFILNKSLLANAKNDMIIMHPLPRVNEIATDVDEDRRAKYFDQVENGLYVRMALLAFVLGKIDIRKLSLRANGERGNLLNNG
ncbi:MAG: Aspartate carbamoyltransferase [candidate division CPR2 bacterium GW2011_GWC1_41_48]|uniref:Aspartate carbamoyltransferase n=1 Tax=candidate division CPR2 bacterium GW2011_GWC1_41_48 TaxID=1618344 RepID=A0A0G0WBM7_UNCC2|nr:MAG: Aspartate carbamoyltransferase [candidate division CPR2 bacterium GW2011_GWC2_39_35]KKR28985.1 MAG: Aspartate carbamoyltransferase [candidate division CPR2 bacterium GW2011_GWD2_39_7]KKR29261.1 MAG: Aspartate carbamoyltransferase [candidate division CPR2 bacterium GW2011_GWD1_39_7]KKS09482.1 MAG: Aspartate carbamoyltransferase [candidate division CPR2 bacterium GW2011_GWC1_41_48]OGB62190.1 MAG: aspartate carbamoyltransferase [candidate division CPR2 bacterium GWD1_39_7]OGB70385.1 MAG: 